MSPRSPLVAIIGATGTGKSQLAVSLAQRFNGEIINSDALQMYEGLPVTTNKLTSAERKGIRHHLLGCIKLGEKPWTVMQFVERARKVIDEIRSRGKLPIVVGGTHYYTQSLLFRNAVVNESSDHMTHGRKVQSWPILDASTSELLNELRKVDPDMAMRWHPNDRRKIRRSLEVYLMTGRKASDIYKQQQSSQAGRCSYNANQTLEKVDQNPPCNESESLLHYDTLIFWVHTSPEILNTRLEERVDNMVSAGLIEEVGSMYEFLQTQLKQGHEPDQSRGVWVAIGFKELVPYITDNNHSDNSKNEAVERTKIATRQYAKRQVRWIRLRLQRALKAANAGNILFPLDANDVSRWSQEVSTKASTIAAAFLDGQALPQPTIPFDVASKETAIPVVEARFTRFCTACGKTLMSESEWVTHLNGKGHRSAVRPKIDWSTIYPRNNSR